MASRASYPKQSTPLKAIKYMCLECCGGPDNPPAATLVRDCVAVDCPLHEFRLGKNPYLKQNLTDEQRQERADQFKTRLESRKRGA